jgi:hypothetical protein
MGFGGNVKWQVYKGGFHSFGGVGVGVGVVYSKQSKV